MLQSLHRALHASPRIELAKGAVSVRRHHGLLACRYAGLASTASLSVDRIHTHPPCPKSSTADSSSHAANSSQTTTPSDSIEATLCTQSQFSTLSEGYPFIDAETRRSWSSTKEGPARGRRNSTAGTSLRPHLADQAAIHASAVSMQFDERCCRCVLGAIQRSLGSCFLVLPLLAAVRRRAVRRDGRHLLDNVCEHAGWTLQCWTRQSVGQ
jgi:hypothetical protein